MANIQPAGTREPAGPNRRARRHPELAAGARRWASVQDVADHLGVTDRTVRQMIADGRITGYRNGRRLIRIDLNEVDAKMTAFGVVHHDPAQERAANRSRPRRHPRRGRKS